MWTAPGKPQTPHLPGVPGGPRWVTDPLSLTRPHLPGQAALRSAGTRFLWAPPPSLLASFLPGVAQQARPTAPREALNVAWAAGRPEGGGGRERLGPASQPPPARHVGPGPRALTRLASQTLQQFPVPSPPDCAEPEPGQEAERCGFSSRNLYIYIYIYIFFFFKANKPGKAWDKPS